MKCSRCGEECKDNQAFCLKCGSPIQVVPDFNLIEAEIANSVGELLDNDNDNVNEDKEDTDMKTKVFEDDINFTNTEDDMQLKMIDISRKGNREPSVDKTFITISTAKSNSQAKKEAKKKEEELKKAAKKKKNIIIGSVTIVVLLITAIIITIIATTGSSTTSTYETYYSKAKTAFDSKDYETAIDNLIKAVNLATNDNQKRSARVMLHDSYVNTNEVTDRYAGNLYELIKLYSDSIDYYKLLADYYINNKLFDKLSDIINSAKNIDVIAVLQTYLLKSPVISISNENTNKEIVITAEDGYKVYYTIDGTIPNKNSTEYTSPVSLEKEGAYTINAIAYNAEGLFSQVVSIKENVSTDAPEIPMISPKTGTYDADTKITISIPTDCKVYYTLDGSIPSKDSTEYKEPFDMPRGNTTIKVIAISKDDLQSSLTEESYNLQLPRVYDIDQAKTKVLEALINNSGYIIDEDCNTSDGATVSVEYTTYQYIDNDEYIVFTIIRKDTSNMVVDTIYYGIGSVTGLVKILNVETDGNYIIE